jgi:hypothetical protein
MRTSDLSQLANALATAERLQEVRRAARDIRGERYAEDMAVFKLTIQGYAKKHDLDLLPAALELGRLAQAKGETVAFMLFLAALVEMTEEA